MTSGVPVVFILTVLFIGNFENQPHLLMNILIGSLVIGMWVSNVILSSSELKKELRLGNIQNLFLSNTSLLSIMFIRGITYSSLGTVTFFAMFIFINLNYDIQISKISIVSMFLCIIFSVINLAVVGTMLAGLSVLVKDFSVFSTLFTRIIFILSGAIIPVSFLPGPIEYFSYILSPMWIVKFFQGIASGSITANQAWVYILIIIFISLIYTYIANIVYKKIETLYMNNQLNEV
ncbi:ABC transporter permease [Shouchella lehensis]|nr:hypothetical protein [Shouchella lehensis]